MMILMFGVTALFLILGIVFSTGRGAFLIAGYNTSSKEEQEKYDEKALCKFMGKGMFGIAFSTLLWAFSFVFSQKWLFTVGMICFVAIIAFILVYANTGNRFKK